MSRFDHIEIGDTGPSCPDNEPSENELVDEHDYVERADQAFRQENYERALTFYSRALQYDINMEEAWLGQIRCLIELGELQEAVIWAGRALERFQNSAVILAVRGVAESRLGNVKKALEYADAAFAIKGAPPFAWVARGEILLDLNLTNAKACFVKAVESSSGDADVREWISQACMAHRNYHMALEHLRHVVREDPERYMCWYQIGRCCEALSEIDDARNAYYRAVSACPTFAAGKDALRALERRGAGAKLVDGLKRLFGGRR